MSIGCLSYFQLFSRPPGTATGMATDDMGVQHPCTPVRVLVLGHSFVRRLREHLDRLATPPFGLRPAGHLVRLVGLGGLQFPRLLRQLRAVCEPGYDLVLLDFGTNDLAAGCSAELLADRVMAVAETMLDSYGVKRVVVFEVFPRADGRYRCPPEFNAEARRFNILIRERLASSNQIHFHHHKGMVTNWQQYLVDGVHLNSLGMSKYSTSVRRAILRHSSRYPNWW